MKTANKKVWIKCSKTRGAEVIKILQDLGAENLYNHTGAGDNCILFIDHDNCISRLGLFRKDRQAQQLIKNMYTEIRLPRLFRYGDFIVNNNYPGNWMLVRYVSDDNAVRTFASSIDGVFSLYTDLKISPDSWSLASYEDIQKFNGMIIANGYRFGPHRFDKNRLELVKIDEDFEPLTKVLVRNSDDDIWMVTLYSHYDKGPNTFHTVSGSFINCIPYDNKTKHLLGTSNCPKK